MDSNRTKRRSGRKGTRNVKKQQGVASVSPSSRVSGKPQAAALAEFANDGNGCVAVRNPDGSVRWDCP